MEPRRVLFRRRSQTRRGSTRSLSAHGESPTRGHSRPASRGLQRDIAVRGRQIGSRPGDTDSKLHGWKQNVLIRSRLLSQWLHLTTPREASVRCQETPQRQHRTHANAETVRPLLAAILPHFEAHSPRRVIRKQRLSIGPTIYRPVNIKFTP